MKNLLLCFYMLLCFANISAAQTKDISGIWEGKLNAGGVEIRVVFHFTKNADSSYTGKMDSPDQGVTGISCSKVTVNRDSIIAEIRAINGAFKGLIVGDSVINGNWVQGPAVLPLVLHSTKEVSQVNRPQTPKPPYTYNSEDVEYDNADKSVHFGATFTYPKTAGPFPTAILITGSGQQDRDETIFAHKPFAVIADYLTKKGYAVLRVDDRGVGKTTGEVKTATSADFAKDVEAGLAYLKTRAEVNKNKLGMIGHSEGGLIESIVASRNKDIDFMIMLAGPGTKGTDLLADQNEAILISSGISNQAAAAYKPLYSTLVATALSSTDTSAAIDTALKQYLSWKKETSQDIIDQLNFNNTDDARTAISSIVKEVSLPWFRYFLETDPAQFIQKVHCKVLALDGSKDIQVLPEQNLADIKAALQKSKSKVFETKEIDGLNHLFQHCKICAIQEYGQLEETFAPEALDIMGSWLDENVMNKN